MTAFFSPKKKYLKCGAIYACIHCSIIYNRRKTNAINSQTVHLLDLYVVVKEVLTWGKGT